MWGMWDPADDVRESPQSEPGVDGDAGIFLRQWLRPVEIQDSIGGLFVIQASDGTIRTDGRPVGENGTALSGQADGPRAKRTRQPALRRGGAMGGAHG